LKEPTEANREKVIEELTEAITEGPVEKNFFVDAFDYF
jgi:hypothetical protein